MRLKGVMLAVVLILTTLIDAVAQTKDTTALNKNPSYDNRLPKVRCGPPLSAGIFIFEVCAFGFSYYASKPEYYGDKAMGVIYGGSAILISIAMFNEYISHGKIEKKYIPDVISTLLIGYGLSRMAVYNLTVAKSTDFRQRYNRNIIEFHTTYLVPFAVGELAEVLLKRNDKKSINKTTLNFTGTGLRLSIKL